MIGYRGENEVASVFSMNRYTHVQSTPMEDEESCPIIYLDIFFFGEREIPA